MATTRDKLDEIRHPKLLALRGMKIGPIFPLGIDIEGMLVGSRGVPRRKTKPPFSDTITREKGDFMNFKEFTHLPYRVKRRRKKRAGDISRRKNR